MEYEVDVKGMEEQRAKEIKKKGKYLEVSILVDAEDEKYNENISGKMPVITTHMHGCGPKEVACMYLTLKALAKQFEIDYPMECLLGEITMHHDYIGSFKTEVKHDEEKKED